MRTVRWILLVYAAVTLLTIVGLVVAPALVPRPAVDPQTLYLAYPADVKSLDPIEFSDNVSFWMAGNIYECLYDYDYDARPYRLFPELASDMPRVSDDGTVYTIPLRRGIRYYDPDKVLWPGGEGPEVKAADFVFAWKRILDFGAASSNANHLEHLAGADEWRQYTERQARDGRPIDWARPFAGAVAVDDATLRVTLDHPFPQFVYVLAHLPTAPVPRAVVDRYGRGFNDHPIGTGAYCLRAADHRRQVSLVFHANPLYRGRPDVDGHTPVPPGQRMPFVKRLDYRFFNEELPRWFVFQQGHLDVIDTIPKETFSQALNSLGQVTQAMRDRGVGVRTEPEPAITFLSFNADDPTVGPNPPLRQAISMAIDRRRLIDVYYSAMGVPSTGVVPPGFEIYDASPDSPYVRFDLDGARAKLREAERVHGGPIPPVRLLMPGTDALYRQLGEYLKHQLAKLGLRADVECTNWANFLDIVEKKRTAQIFYSGWQFDWPDEQNVFQTFWSRNIREGGLNGCGYRSPEFDAAYEAAVKAQPGPRRLALYRRMRSILNEDCPVAFLFSPVAASPRHDWVTDYRIATYPHGRAMFAKLDGAARADWLARHKR